MHHRRLRLALASALFLAVAATGCGGGSSESSSTTSPSSGATGTTPSVPKDGTLPPYTPPKHTFEEVDGSRARFVNLFVIDGKGSDLDVYWGNDAETGKKATTVAYGEASDWMPIKLDKDPMLAPADGSQEVQVSFYLPGKKDRESLVTNKQETLKGEMSLTYTMGWTTTFDATTMPGSLGVGYEHEAGDPPAGKAWVALNTGGIGGIEGGDFMVLSGPGGCQSLVSAEVDGGTANSGAAYPVDPGTTEFTASDANTECAEKTDPVEIDLQAGDRYVIYAYGTTKADRQLLALKIDG